MEARSLQFIAAACGGEPLSGSPDTLIGRVCTDSRQVRPGDLFFALPGERFDGHAFLPEVASKGAAAAVVARRQAPPSLPNCALIAVDDTRHALGRLAARYRQDFSLPIVAVGGSNGKTTTKELVASVLSQAFVTLRSEGSFNNDIGVPLTLLGLEKAHQAAVLEAGTNHPGELAPLVRMICPRLGVLTGIAREHLEFFGDLAGVAQEEGWLAELLPVGGVLFANGDCEWTAPIARRTRAALVRVGLSPANDWRACSLRPDKQGVTFRVEGPRADVAGEFRINLLGRHQVVNALFALAVGRELGLGRAEIARGLAHCKPAKMRLQLWELNGVCLLDDAYNANADSMLAALQTLQELPCKGHRVAVLGDMAELGVQSAAAHEEVGRQAAELGVSQLFAVGKMAPLLARGARGAGLSRVLEFADVEGAAVALRQFLKKGDVVLLKASRATRLERIAERLRGGEVVKRN
jgi:UDP-N-acetylmuramoyl-tripeptide--D-alanyl-D-alanine ligase